MRIYISGPMTGFVKNNFPAFDKAKEMLERAGYEVVSPADLERMRGELSYEDCMKDDLRHLLECDAIYLLKKWELSRGARVERLVAGIIGLKIINQ